MLKAMRYLGLVTQVIAIIGTAANPQALAEDLTNFLLTSVLPLFGVKGVDENAGREIGEAVAVIVNIVEANK